MTQSSWFVILQQKIPEILEVNDPGLIENLNYRLDTSYGQEVRAIITSLVKDMYDKYGENSQDLLSLQSGRYFRLYHGPQFIPTLVFKQLVVL